MVEKEFYERMYGGGGASPGKQGALSRLRRKLTLDRLEASFRLLERGEKLVDLGCGEGILAFKAADKYEFCYGIDIVSRPIARARKQAEARGDARRFNFIEGNLNQSLPYPESYFDAVTCTSVLAHIFDPYALVKESHRVLKNNGILIIQVPNLSYVRYRMAILFGKLPAQSDQIGWNGGILHYFTVDTLGKLLRREGFTIEKKTCSGTFVALRRLWLPLLGADIIIKARKTKKVLGPHLGEPHD